MIDTGGCFVWTYFCQKVFYLKFHIHLNLHRAKKISLRKTPLEDILDDISCYRNEFAYKLVTQENIIGSRFKSEDSIMRKYEKTLKNNGGFKQCFNDVLGVRLHFKDYPEDFPSYFRVVDLRNGKQVDDGYRAIHLYYQRDSHSYPIEVQLWCGDDYLFNIWSHKWIYKYLDPVLGRALYYEYKNGKIKTEDDFILKLNEMRE